MPVTGGEIYSLERRALGVWPTNDGMVVVYTGWPHDEFVRYRADVEGNFWRTIRLVPRLAERLAAGRREERFFGTADLPNFFRKPYGPGWALVGDAGLHKDPISGLGIGDAFRDAELLAEALYSGLGGSEPIETALAGYEQRRNAAAQPSYELTLKVAALAAPGIEERELFAALRRDQAATDRFFGVLTGSVPAADVFAPANLFRIISVRGVARIVAHKLRARGAQAPRQGNEVA